MGYRGEKGEIILEGLIVMIITMLMVIWVLAIGFIYYQRNLLVVITNDAASKIAVTYNNPDSDIIMGYVSSNELSERDLYRNFCNSSLVEVNKEKAKIYVEKMLLRTNFAGTIEKVDVEMKLIHDSPVRKHIEITAKCTFNTPFGSVLEIFGINGQIEYEAVGRADCTDIMDYLSTVDYASYQITSAGNSGKIIKMINSLIKLFNHIYTSN